MVAVEEVELDLGLSIGGTFTKSTIQKAAPNSEPDSYRFDSDPHHAMQPALLDPQDKREIQALRRMEVKKKREQKRDRVRELEPEPELQQVFKKEKMNCPNGMSRAWTTPPFPINQCTTVQYVPLSNGFPLPYWVAGEKNAGGIDGANCGDIKVKSNGSSRCSSSAVSDYQCSSREDGGSTDSRSHSVHSLAEPTRLNSSKEMSNATQPEESASASSHPTRSKSGNNNAQHERKHIVKEAQPNITKPKPMKSNEEAATCNKALSMPVQKSLLYENSNNGPLKDTKGDIMGKPPKPLSQISSLPQMPYVSTKGNGPNGKTVNGFLYRYTKSEVSIVCVCHGSTFSPAEFVQHAGGTDISHPLRHITVIPSAFG